MTEKTNKGVVGITPMGRVLWSYFPDEDGKNRLTLAVPKDDKALQRVVDDATKAAKALFGDSVNISTLNMPFKDGDTEVDSEGNLMCEKYPALKGTVYFQAKTTFEVKKIGKDGKETLDLDIYNGCYARLAYTAKAYGRPRKGVSLYLTAIQKLADGEPLGGDGVSVESLFNDEISVNF